jgi:hypothetical protein
VRIDHATPLSQNSSNAVAAEMRRRGERRLTSAWPFEKSHVSRASSLTVRIVAVAAGAADMVAMLAARRQGRAGVSGSSKGDAAVVDWYFEWRSRGYVGIEVGDEPAVEDDEGMDAEGRLRTASEYRRVSSLVGWVDV